MPYRLAGASYRSIAAKLTEDRANASVDANGVSVERAMKQLPHVSTRTAWDDVTAELEELWRETEMPRADLVARPLCAGCLLGVQIGDLDGKAVLGQLARKEARQG